MTNRILMTIVVSLPVIVASSGPHTKQTMHDVYTRSAEVSTYIELFNQLIPPDLAPSKRDTSIAEVSVEQYDYAKSLETRIRDTFAGAVLSLSATINEQSGFAMIMTTADGEKRDLNSVLIRFHNSEWSGPYVLHSGKIGIHRGPGTIILNPDGQQHSFMKFDVVTNGPGRSQALMIYLFDQTETGMIDESLTPSTIEIIVHKDDETHTSPESETRSRGINAEMTNTIDELEVALSDPAHVRSQSISEEGEQIIRSGDLSEPGLDEALRNYLGEFAETMNNLIKSGETPTRPTTNMNCQDVISAIESVTETTTPTPNGYAYYNDREVLPCVTRETMKTWTSRVIEVVTDFCD